MAEEKIPFPKVEDLTTVTNGLEDDDSKRIIYGGKGDNPHDTSEINEHSPIEGGHGVDTWGDLEPS